MEEKTLDRDAVALNMNPALIPMIKSQKEIEQLCVKYGWDVPDENNHISRIKFQLNYTAMIQYHYADVIIAERMMKRNHNPNTQSKLTIIK